ncbi:hypothetical protein [Gilvibacter sp.]|uniref:hypothetical protein n=1 Tax=Gilvibacter sp. TaxID=2729997 RepID=UPI003F4A48CE
MNPKLPLKAITFVMALLVSTGLFAQETAKRVVLSNVTAEVSKMLVDNGVDLRCGVTHDHDASSGHDVLKLELLPTELKTLDRLNIPYMVLIDDLYAHYEEVAAKDLPLAKAQLAQMKAVQAERLAAKGSVSSTTQDSFLQYTGSSEIDWAIPANFNLGSKFWWMFNS